MNYRTLGRTGWKVSEINLARDAWFFNNAVVVNRRYIQEDVSPLY